MSSPVAVVLLLVIFYGTLCAVLSQDILSLTEQKGPLQVAMNKMAIFNEEPCVRQGGQCMVRDRCPEGKLAEQRGLCPAQQSNDVECCHYAARSASDSSRCEALGGLCRSDHCGVPLQAADDDCPASEVCCALVN